MLQNGNEAGKLTPVTRLWSWKKSSISIVTSLEGDGSKLLMRCASPNVRSKSGSKTVAWSGRKKTSPNLMAVMASMIRRRVPSEPPRRTGSATRPCRPEWTTPKLLSYKLSSCNFNQVSLNAQSFYVPLWDSNQPSNQWHLPKHTVTRACSNLLQKHRDTSGAS